MRFFTQAAMQQTRVRASYGVVENRENVSVVRRAPADGSLGAVARDEFGALARAACFRLGRSFLIRKDAAPRSALTGRRIN
jgi:hypothetical protein